MRRQTKKEESTNPIERKAKLTTNKITENVTEIFQAPTASKTLPPNPVISLTGNVNVNK